MQFFLVAILAMAVNAWESGDNGVVLYDHNCDFNDATFPTISIRDSSAELCGRVCINSADSQVFRCQRQQVLVEGRTRRFRWKCVPCWCYLRFCHCSRPIIQGRLETVGTFFGFFFENWDYVFPPLLIISVR